MGKRLLAALAVVALAIGSTGVVLAATGTPTFAKACVTSKGVLRLVSNGSCGNMKTINVVTRAYPGVAKGYAFVIGGEVQAAQSWNVTQSNLYTTGNGSYCFRNLPFTPKHAQVSLSYWGPANGDIPMITMDLPPNQNTDCNLDTVPQLYVFTGLVDPGVFTDGVQFGFYVVMY